MQILSCRELDLYRYQTLYQTMRPTVISTGRCDEADPPDHDSPSVTMLVENTLLHYRVPPTSTEPHVHIHKCHWSL